MVVKDRRVKEKLAKHYRQAWSVALATQYRPWTTGSGLRRHLAANDEPMTKLLRAVQWQVDHSAAIPVQVVPCLGGGARAGRVPYLPSPHVLASGVAGSIHPSVQNLLLAARAMGLGAGLVTLPLWSVTSARKILGLHRRLLPTASSHSVGHGALRADAQNRSSRSRTSTGTATATGPTADRGRPAGRFSCPGSTRMAVLPRASARLTAQRARRFRATQGRLQPRPAAQLDRLGDRPHWDTSEHEGPLCG